MYCCLISPCPLKQNSINTNKDLVFSKAGKVANLPDQDLCAVLQRLWVGPPFPSSPVAHCQRLVFFFLDFHATLLVERWFVSLVCLFVECLSLFFFWTGSFSVPSWPPKSRLVCVHEYGLAGTTPCWCCTWTEEGFFLPNLGCFPISV